MGKNLIFCVSELVDFVKQNNILNDRLGALEGVNEVPSTVIDKFQQENDNLKKELN